MNAAKGFTLIELVAVVFIVGLVVSVVVLNVSRVNPHDKLDSLTTNAAKLLRFSNQEALLSNKHLAISIDQEKYAFLELQGEDWKTINKSPLKARKIPSNLTHQLLIDGKIVDLENKEKKLKPHVLLLSNGEMTPFEWQFIDKANNYEVTLLGSLTGAIAINKKVYED